MCPKELCCGCGLCVAQCPVKAIRMNMDEEGFLYPEMDEQNCIHCNKCVEICPVLNTNISDADAALKISYAGYCVNESDLLSCSSGGAAYAISKKIIDMQGVVFGVRYEDDFRGATYTMVSKREELACLSKSKYVESDRSVLFSELEKQLSLKKQVLVVGLPCDIAAVRSLVGYPDNLLTCALICKSNTSRKALTQFLDAKEREYKSKVSSLDLRYKKEHEPTFPSWIKIEFENSEFYEGYWTEQDFYKAFFILTRPSCSNCKFKSYQNLADIIIGDFQGINKENIYYNPQGVSLICPNTEKGLNILKKLDHFKLYEVPYEEAAGYNWMIRNSIPVSEFRQKFSENFIETGLKNACDLLRTDQNNILDILKEQYASSGQKVIVWGAGDTAYHMYKRLNMSNWNIAGFFDSSFLKIGKNFMGHIVQSISKIGKYNETADVLIVIIPSENEEKLNQMVRALGWKKEICHVGKYKYYK